MPPIFAKRLWVIQYMTRLHVRSFLKGMRCISGGHCGARAPTVSLQFGMASILVRVGSLGTVDAVVHYIFGDVS